MALVVTILNRQRRVSVDIPRIREMTRQLSHELFRNVHVSRPKWLKSQALADMEAGGELTLMLVSNEKIRLLNKQWRGKDYATDVLSFPLALDENRNIIPSDAAGTDQLWELGELVISLEKTAEQAAEYGHSFEREFAFLFVHGFLHLLGFDHITKEQESQMFGQQREILACAGFTR